MLIRILSDLHLEFGYLNLPEMADEAQQVLVLAGDIGLASHSWSYVPFLEETSERFRDVIYIMGNHEYYRTSILRGFDKIRERVQFEFAPTNVHILDNEVITIDDVSFVCSTLWSDFDNHNPWSMYTAEVNMSDFNIIRTGPKSEPYQRKFKPADALALHVTAKRFVFDSVKEEKGKGRKVVVVTHHAPSVLSIGEKFKTPEYQALNGAYASKLEEEIFNSKPDLMIHGHTHTSFDYELVDELYGAGVATRIICNPRGYHGQEINTGFNPTLVVDL